MKIILTALAFMLASCGGGGSSTPVTGTITPAPPLRNDLLFGYFAQDSTTVLETQLHANLLWTTGDLTDQMGAMTIAKADGRKVVVQMSLCRQPLDQGETNARWWLQHLHDAGLLANVIAISWCDEPNTSRSGSWTDDAAVQMNAAVRRAMATFPELHAFLAVIYACVGLYPGIASFDWIGCDDYDIGCDVIRGFYADFASTLLPGQRLFVVPGGADPWRQDPACFLSYAERTPSVVAIVAFIWQTVTDSGATYTGIRANSTKALYQQAGCTVVTGANC